MKIRLRPHQNSLLLAAMVMTLYQGYAPHPGSAQPEGPPEAPHLNLTQEAVQLNLIGVTAERFDQDMLFDCDTTLLNKAGATLKVKSNFASAFDGLELVVLDEKGKRLVQQPYTWHQSPQSFLNTREFLLKPGANQKHLVFPIRDLPRQLKTVQVLLIGTLPGSDYAGLLCSDVVAVVVATPSPAF